MKYQAAILVNTGCPLEVDTIELNSLRASQVLIKVHSTGVCRSQLYEIDGLRGHDKYLPHLLGHEAVGKVVDVGPLVNKVKPGDEVLLSWIKGSGLEGDLPDLSWNSQKLNSGHLTTFSEFTVCSENRVTPLSSITSHPLGPLFGCAIPTGYSLSLTTPNIYSAKYILIYGLGGIGMFALRGVLDNSKAHVIGVDIDYSRLSFASQIGCHFTINPSNTDLLSAVRDITSGTLCDLVFESTGLTSAISESVSLIHNSGIVKFVSHPPHGEKIQIDPFELILGKRIEGSWAGGCTPDIHLPNILSRIQSDSSMAVNYPYSRYHLTDINLAVSDMKSGTVLRPLITFE